MMFQLKIKFEIEEWKLKLKWKYYEGCLTQESHSDFEDSQKMPARTFVKGRLKNI